jgi:hypothetical protein
VSKISCCVWWVIGGLRSLLWICVVFGRSLVFLVSVFGI